MEENRHIRRFLIVEKDRVVEAAIRSKILMHFPMADIHCVKNAMEQTEWTKRHPIPDDVFTVHNIGILDSLMMVGIRATADKLDEKVETQRGLLIDAVARIEHIENELYPGGSKESVSKLVYKWQDERKKIKTSLTAGLWRALPWLGWLALTAVAGVGVVKEIVKGWVERR